MVPRLVGNSRKHPHTKQIKESKEKIRGMIKKIFAVLSERFFTWISLIEINYLRRRLAGIP
jgi:hypothetical protein